RGKHCHDHLDDERNADQPSEKTEDKEQTPEDLQVTHEMSREFRERNSQFSEPANTLVREYEFHESFPKKHASRHNPDEDGRRCPFPRLFQKPFDHSSHTEPLFRLKFRTSKGDFPRLFASDGPDRSIARR